MRFHEAEIETADKLPDGTDLDKLAKAVARHETGSCTIGNSALVHNNCFGVRECSGGRCYGFKTYDTIEDSYEEFKRLWRDKYGKFPNSYLAKRYSGSDRADHWLANVTSVYNSL